MIANKDTLLVEIMIANKDTLLVEIMIANKDTLLVEIMIANKDTLLVEIMIANKDTYSTILTEYYTISFLAISHSFQTPPPPKSCKTHLD